MRKTPILAILATAATLSACSSAATPAPKPSVHAAPAASTPAAVAAACSKLAASALPLAAYDELLIAEANHIGGGGTLSKAQERRVHAVVAAEVALGCPKFSYLAGQDK